MNWRQNELEASLPKYQIHLMLSNPPPPSHTSYQQRKEKKIYKVA